ncbi:putative ribonuclease H-like domain-containing protein [Tanacetum coccineum]
MIKKHLKLTGGGKIWESYDGKRIGEGYSFTKKKCFVCGSLSHLIKDCDYYEKKMAREAEVKKQRVLNTGNMMAKPVWTNMKDYHANQFVPRPILDTGTTGHKRFSPKRPQGNWGSAVKTSAGYNWRNTRPNSNCNGGPTFIRTDHPLKNMVDRGIFDSGCSGHMTGNKDPTVENFERIHWGICYLWRDSKRLLDCFDMKTPSLIKGFACLIAKATSDKSRMWHMRLGNDLHVLLAIKESNTGPPARLNLEKIITEPLQHLCIWIFFWPTSVKAFNHASYCLWITVDCTRFVRYCFLASKDETQNGNLQKLLDTLSVLGKFDGKSDEGFLVGYSLNSKAYRVYNLVTKRVEVNLHVNFLEDKPNVKRANPHAGASEVTNSAGTSQTPNSNASEEKDEDVELIVVPSAVKNTEEKVESRTSSTNSKKEEILTEPQQEKEASSTDTSEDNPKILAFRRELEEIALKHLGTVSKNNSTSTPLVNSGSEPVNTGRLDPDDSPMPELKIFHKSETGIFDEASYDEEGVITDFNSLPTEIEVSPTPTLRIHNIHPKSQILGDPKLAVQTRSKVQQQSGAQALFSYIQKQQRNNYKDQHHCLFACFLSQEEPKKISEALQDDSWVQAMQEELLQFKLQQVWVLVDLPHGMKVIGTKWVYRNKRDKRGVVVRNKARFGGQGYPQAEGIDYDEFLFMWQVIEAIRCSKLCYGQVRGERNAIKLLELRTQEGYHVVQVYVDDIIFGSTKKSWCDEFEALMQSRFQMSSMGELTFFLGLQVKQNTEGIFISQDKYVAEILKKFDLVSVKTAITPMETKVALTKDEEAINVDSLSKTSHLNAMKRIFKYLKDKPNLGLWYPRESPFDLEAFSDSDYGGSNLDRKSTTGGCQFLRQRLISWQCKKQTIVATSTTEAEYVAAANCCGQHVFLCFRLILAGIAWFVDVRKVLIVKQFWQTATAKTLADGTLELHATIDTIVYTITEASIRNKLQLADASGITMLPNSAILRVATTSPIYGTDWMSWMMQFNGKTKHTACGKAILLLVDRGVKSLEVALRGKTRRFFCLIEEKKHRSGGGTIMILLIKERVIKRREELKESAVVLVWTLKMSLEFILQWYPVTPDSIRCCVPVSRQEEYAGKGIITVDMYSVQNGMGRVGYNKEDKSLCNRAAYCRAKGISTQPTEERSQIQTRHYHDNTVQTPSGSQECYGPPLGSHHCVYSTGALAEYINILDRDVIRKSYAVLPDTIREVADSRRSQNCSKMHTYRYLQGNRGLDAAYLRSLEAANVALSQTSS